MFRLMPKQTKLFEHFEQQAQLAVEAAGALKALLATLDKPEEALKRIEQIEQQGDSVNHSALRMLQEHVSLPFENVDVLALLGELDDVIDGADLAAHRLVLYKVRSIKPEAAQLADLLERACVAMGKAVLTLRTGKHVNDIMSHVTEVKRLENEGDKVMRGALGDLFESEKDAIELIKWRELFEFLEQTLDHAEHVAKAVERIALDMPQ